MNESKLGSISVWVRTDNKTPTVNVRWNDGRSRNKSFGPARFTEAWIEAFNFYTYLLNEKIIDDMNTLVHKHIDIDYDLFKPTNTPDEYPETGRNI